MSPAEAREAIDYLASLPDPTPAERVLAAVAEFHTIPNEPNEESE